MDAPKQAIIVLGMHRSGTSGFTGLLHLLGVDLGPCLLAAQDANAAGYWEHEDVVCAHEQLLILLGSSWDDYRTLPPDWNHHARIEPIRDKLLEIVRRDFSESRLWSLKDPRMCRLLPLWLEIFNQLCVNPIMVLVARHPYETVRSLEKRNGFSSQKSQLLWLRHTLEAEYFTRGLPRLAVLFDDYLRDPLASLERVRQKVGSSWPVPLDRVSDQLASFVDPGKRHHRAQKGADAEHLSPWLTEAHHAMQKFASGDEAGMMEIMDRLQKNLADATAIFEPMLRDCPSEAALQLEQLRDQFEMRLSQSHSDVHSQLQQAKRALKEKSSQLSSLQKAWPLRLAGVIRRKKPSANSRATPLDFPVMSSPEISVIVAAKNAPAATRKTLEAILRNRGNVALEIVIVDDASDEPLESSVRATGAVYWRDEIERGISFSRNRGAQHAKATLLLFIESGIEIDSGALDAMLQSLAKNEHVGVVGSPPAPDHSNPALEGVDFCHGLLLISKNVFFQVGGFDRRYRDQRFAEADLALKLQGAGRKTVHPQDLKPIRPVSEKGGLSEMRARDLEESRRRFARRWNIATPNAK